MNNLKKFSTEAEYGSATLNYPAVSWVTATDKVHFDKGAPTPVVNDKVIIASYGGEGETTFNFFNCEASSSGDITSILFDDVEVNPITCDGDYVDASQTYIAKYTLNTTSVGDWFTGYLGCGAASTPSNLDVLIPSQITSIGANYPSNTAKLVCLATTPPEIEGLQSVLNAALIYVPDDAVNTYKNDGSWGEVAANIYPISEYSGNLPV